MHAAGASLKGMSELLNGKVNPKAILSNGRPHLSRTDRVLRTGNNLGRRFKPGTKRSTWIKVIVDS